MAEKKQARYVAVMCAALVLAIAAAWIVFDGLFSPLEKRAETVEIPSFCGADIDGIDLPEWLEVTRDYRYDAGSDAGVILSQSPAGGSRRKLTADAPTCRLTLVISLGEETRTLPDVMGKDAREAESSLRALGFAVEVRRVEGAYPAGTVYDIEPRVGTALPLGARVMLTVSNGMPSESVAVPDLRGLTRSDALVRAWLSKLTVGEVIEQDADAPSGTVIAQSLQPNTTVPSGSVLTLYVSREEQ